MRLLSPAAFVLSVLLVSGCSVPAKEPHNAGHTVETAEPERAATVTIGALRSVEPQGCGCYFSAAANGKGVQSSPAYLFISDAMGNAYVNVNGADLTLSEVGRKFGAGEYGYCSTGRCAYSRSGISAITQMSLAQGCPPEPSECEV
ncbi:MAG: hypothetical protein ACK2UO_04230, partial [Caldilineaceae bacterium]